MRRGRYGLRSILFGLGSAVLATAAIAAFAALPEGTPEPWPTIATGAMIATLLLISPALHVVGLGFGIASLVRAGDSKVAGAFGILVNLIVLGGGVLLIWAALTGLAAYT